MLQYFMLAKKKYITLYELCMYTSVYHGTLWLIKQLPYTTVNVIHKYNMWLGQKAILLWLARPIPPSLIYCAEVYILAGQTKATYVLLLVQTSQGHSAWHTSFLLNTGTTQQSGEWRKLRQANVL